MQDRLASARWRTLQVLMSHSDIAVLATAAGTLMPSTKKQLRTRVTDDIKRDFGDLADQQGLTEAQLLSLIVSQVLSRNPATPVAAPNTGGAERRDVRVPLRLAEYKAIQALAETRGWPATVYVAQLVRTHLSQSPRFSDDELLALRRATAELSAIGRNINQIARALNSDPSNAPIAGELPSVMLMQVIAEQRTALKSVIKANLAAWGVDHE